MSNPIGGQAPFWRDAVGWEGCFQVSDHGQVRSLDRVIPYVDGRVRHHKGRVLRPYQRPDGYYTVRLSGNGRLTTVKVHHLVLEAFVGPCPQGQQGCHRDGNGLNNRLDNLRWDTQAGNEADKERTYTTHCSQGHELTPENTYYNAARYQRQCRTCDRERTRRRRGK